MGFDKDRRPIWRPGDRKKLLTISSTATVIPSYGINLFAASTVAGTKKFLIANPLPFTGSGGTEVSIMMPNKISGSSATKNVVVSSTRTSFVTSSSKTYQKLIFKPGAQRGLTLQMISLSTSKFYIINKTTGVSLSTSST